MSPPRRPEAGQPLGDLIRIIARTAPADWEAAAGMLGFERSLPDVAALDLSDDVSLGVIRDPPSGFPDAATSEESPLLSEPATAVEGWATGSFDPGPLSPVDWLEGVTPLAPPLETRHHSDSPQSAAADPLLPARTAAGVLAAALSTRRPGRVDARTAVKMIARRQHMRRIPRQTRLTLARGTRLLVDSGTGLLPFRDDVVATIDQVLALVGRSTTVAHYKDDVTGDVWVEGVPDPSGAASDGRSPLLVLSDLGLTNARPRLERPTFAAFASLAEQVHRHGSHVVVLVPAARHQIARCEDSFVAVPWERPTISEVLTARRQARTL